MKAFLLTICFCLLCVTLFAQNAKIDSLNKVIATTKVDTVKAENLCELCNELANVGEFNDALTKAKEGLKILENSSSLRIKHAKCLNNLGFAYAMMGNYIYALDHFQKSFELYHRFNRSNNAAKVLYNIGKIYIMQGNYPSALDAFQKCLKIGEKMKDQQLVYDCLNQLGQIYAIQGNYDTALTFFQKNLKTPSKVNPDRTIAESLNNIGAIYLQKRSFDKALEYFNKGLNYYEQLKDSHGIAECYNNLAGAYWFQKKHDKALDCFQKSLIIKEKSGNPAEISLALINLGGNYLQLSQLKLAKSYIKKGLEIAQSIRYLEYMKLGVHASFQADSALGDWKSAFEYHKLYKQYSDSLHNEDKAKEFGRIESKYQFEKEAEEAQRKQAEVKRKEQLETDRRNNLQYLSIFAGLLVLFGGLAFVGKLKIPARVLDISLFAALLILFEFLLILSEPYIEQFSGGIPIQKLVFNSVIALAFAPLHGFLEGKLKKRFGGQEG